MSIISIRSEQFGNVQLTSNHFQSATFTASAIFPSLAVLLSSPTNTTGYNKLSPDYLATLDSNDASFNRETFESYLALLPAVIVSTPNNTFGVAGANTYNNASPYYNAQLDSGSGTYDNGLYLRVTVSIFVSSPDNVGTTYRSTVNPSYAVYDPQEPTFAIASLNSLVNQSIPLKSGGNVVTGYVYNKFAVQSARGNANAAVANLADVNEAINSLINGAPGILDTLDEIAAALGDDANFATNYANTIAGLKSMIGMQSTDAFSVSVLGGLINGGTSITLAAAFGSLASLTTTAKGSLVAAINELDAEIGVLTSLTTTAKNTLVAAINELDAEIGVLGNLTTAAKTTLVAAINELDTDTANNAAAIGDLRQDTEAALGISSNELDNRAITTLTTTATTVVPAINELDAEIGDVTTLTTTAQVIVDAINELNFAANNVTTGQVRFAPMSEKWAEMTRVTTGDLQGYGAPGTDEMQGFYQNATSLMLGTILSEDPMPFHKINVSSGAGDPTVYGAVGGGGLGISNKAYWTNVQVFRNGIRLLQRTDPTALGAPNSANSNDEYAVFRSSYASYGTGTAYPATFGAQERYPALYPPVIETQHDLGIANAWLANNGGHALAANATGSGGTAFTYGDKHPFEGQPHQLSGNPHAEQGSAHHLAGQTYAALSVDPNTVRYWEIQFGAALGNNDIVFVDYMGERIFK